MIKASGLDRGVVRVPFRSNDDWGAAFFVSPQHLLTCQHVVDNARDDDGLVHLIFTGAEAYDLAMWEGRATPVLSGDREREALDVALLELIGELPPYLRPLILSDEGVPTNLELRSYGFPDNRAGHGAPGDATCIGSAIDPANGRIVLELKSGELTGGFSGAPIVLKASGEVVGIMTDTVNSDSRGRFDDHAWAVPTASIAGWFPEVAVQSAAIMRDLEGFAAQRAPTIFDYAMDSTGFRPEIEPRLGAKLGASIFHPQEILDRLEKERPNFLLVEGAAGSGKSSLLRGWFASLAIARSPTQTTRTPVYVSAASLADTFGAFPERIYTALERDRLVAVRHAEGLKRLTTALSSHPFLFMIDGLDEVQEPIRRSTLVSDLIEWSDQLLDDDHRLIVASRSIDEAIRLREHPGSLPLVMLPITSEERDRFIRKACGGDAVILSERLDQLPANGQAGLPLFLALAVLAFLNGRVIPQSPIGLLERYFQIAWKRSKGTTLSLADTVAALTEVAGAEADHTSLTRQVAISAIAQSLEKTSLTSSAVSRFAAQASLDDITAAGFALRREQDDLHWVHASFQDYFLGLSIADDLRNSNGRSHAGHWTNSRARPALLFALAHLSREQDIEPIIVTVLAGSDDLPPSEAELGFVADLILSGAELQPELTANIIDAIVFTGINLADDFESCRTVFLPDRHPFTLLLALRDSVEGVEERILALLDDSSIPARKKERLARRFVRLGV